MLFFFGTTRVSRYENVSFLERIGAKDDGDGGDNWICETCKALVKSSPTTNQHPAFYRPDAFLSPNQQCQSIEEKNIAFHGLAYPKLTWGLPTLSLPTSCSRLSWRRVVMPLISPLTPVKKL